MGTLYKRGNIWWMKYYRNGKPHYKSSKSPKKMVAKRLLDSIEGEIAQGKVPSVHFDKTTFSQLSDDFLNDYRINQKKSLKRATQSANRLNQFFENYKAQQITTPVIQEYILKRLEDGVSNATINRELSALKRMLNLGLKQTPPLVDRVPHIPMLKENNARKGFFEHNEFIRLREHLPPYLRGMVTFAYKTGWRFTEITGLTWAQVDLEQRIVWLEVGETKNDEGRTVYLDEELQAIIERQSTERKSRSVITPYVFPNSRGTGRMLDIRGSFAKACEKAGIGKRLFHDFRRTAIRNMVRAGVPEQIVMKISGHKTRSVFERYNIVNNEDLKWATRKQSDYLSSLTVTNTVTVTPLATKKGASRNG